MASPLPRFERLPCPTVQLQHELPGGEWHIDWMVARDPEGEQPLMSFRLACPLDELGPGESIQAKRIADHRAAYLDYEGPVGDNRGTVKRLNRGLVCETAYSRDGIEMLMQVRWLWPGCQSDTIQHLNVRQPKPDQCTISCVRLYEAPSAAAAGIAKEES